MNPFSNKITGWTSIAAGICVFGVTCSLMAVFVIGWIGDVLGIIVSVLIIPMLIGIGRIVITKHEVAGRSVQILGVTGTLFDFARLIVLTSGIITSSAGESASSIARGLIGVAVLTFAVSSRKNPELKRLYVWLGIILGVVMCGPLIVLLIPLFLTVDSTAMSENKVLSRSAQALGILGALIEFVLVTLLAIDTSAAQQAIYGHYAGFGALGIAILVSALLNRTNPALRTRFVWLSVAMGWAIVQILIGSAMEDVAVQLIQGGGLAAVNPILLVMLFTMAPIVLLGWPIWLIWTGRLFLKGIVSASESEPTPQTA